MQHCKDHSGHSEKIGRNKLDIQTIFDKMHKLFWRMAILTGTILGIGQGITIIVVLFKVK